MSETSDYDAGRIDYDTQLPLNPSRDNAATDCDLVGRDRGLPEHIEPCACDAHSGVCQNCGFKITVDPTRGVEYGHARANNRNSLNGAGTRRDCIHRPTECNPGGVQVWTSEADEADDVDDGELVTDGGGRHYADSDSGTEWATPPRLWRGLANALGGFDLDPAAGCEPEKIADRRLTKEDNGLASPWYGDVWVNPPYGREINETWAKKIAAEAKRDEVSTITALVPSSTGAEWYQDNYGTADLVTHVRGRVQFLGGDRDASFYSDIVTFGDVPDEYRDVLRSLGQIREIPDSETTQKTLLTDGSGLARSTDSVECWSCGGEATPGEICPDCKAPKPSIRPDGGSVRTLERAERAAYDVAQLHLAEYHTDDRGLFGGGSE